MDEYIVINKTAIQKIFKDDILNKILSQSTHLKPIVEDALNEGMLIQRTINDKVKIPFFRIKDYIANLKLDI